MEIVVPTAEDHCRILILIKMLGHRSTMTFNRLMQTLSKVEATTVSENPKRIILANFVTHYNPELTKFGDLQAHRKIFGFIGVAQSSHSAANSVSESSRASVESDRSEVLNPQSVHEALSRKRSSVDGGNDSIESIKEQYLHLKQELNGSLVDSRCVLLGFPDVEDCGIEQRELISFENLEEFEKEIRELIRSIYIVLESRRRDISFEKMDQPPCPTISEEEKTRVGTENRASKTYKRKCIGRMRKQVGDYSLLTGLPSLALDSYSAAIEYLKNSTDLLWLAAAYEGYACAAMAIKYNETADRLKNQAAIHRVSTMTPEELRDHQEKSQHNLGVTIGHQRYRSDEDKRAVATAAAAAAQLIQQDLEQRKQYKKPWALLTMDRSPTGKSAFEYTEIVEKFRQALENYERFSFLAYIEYECMIRASSVFRHQRMYIETDAFLREHVSKYLDDSFTLFDNIIKAQICVVYSLIYKLMGFQRKTAFFSRLAVLFRLHVNDAESRTENDYKLVYPILYRTLSGYGIVDSSKETRKGPVAVQIKAMHEVYMSALRANLTDAAVRHLCYILQTFYNDLDTTASLKMLDELSKLVATLPKIHSLAQHISLDQDRIILPPLQMTRFPTLSDFKIVRLSPQLAPRIIPAKGEQSVFIFSPFENRNEVNEIYWVTNCGCEVVVKVLNPLPIDLTVKNLAILTEGCTFESIPVRLTLSPYVEGMEPTEIKLLGMPRAAGKLTITGYSCEVLGVRNVCSIKEILPKTKDDSNENPKKDKFTVTVLQELPLLKVDSSLQRSPTIDSSADVAEITIFSGQTFPHSVFIENVSDSLTIKYVELTVRQPKVYGPKLIEVTNMEMKEERKDDFIFSVCRIEKLEPNDKREIQFQIFGIDPSSVDGKSPGSEQRVLIKAAHSTGDILEEDITDSLDGGNTTRNSIVSFSDDVSNLSVGGGSNEHHDFIPYTGRLLTADFIFRYVADIEGPNDTLYERTSTLPLAVCVVPALTVSDHQCLPGESPWNRYVVIQVTNSTDLDTELIYSAEKKVIGVQSGGENPPAVPVLVPCCPNVSARAFREAMQYESLIMQKQELDKLRTSIDKHIAKHLQIRWGIPQLNYSGIVPIGSILADVEFLKQLTVPTVSIDVLVNGNTLPKDKEIGVRIGEMIELEVIISSILKGTNKIKGELSLRCFQDLGNNQESLDRSENMVICGPVKVPIVIEPIPIENQTLNGVVNQSVIQLPKKECKAKFAFLFLYEGKHRILPVIGKCPQSNGPGLAEDEIFVPTIKFDVGSKVVNQ